LKVSRIIRRRVPNRHEAGWFWCEGNRRGVSFGTLRWARSRKRKPRQRAFARQGMPELVAARNGLSQPKGAEGQRQEQGLASRRPFAGEALAAKNRDMSQSEQGREPAAACDKPTEHDDATQRRKHCVGHTSDERRR